VARRHRLLRRPDPELLFEATLPAPISGDLEETKLRRKQKPLTAAVNEAMIWVLRIGC
jgi:hypothetical protein